MSSSVSRMKDEERGWYLLDLVVLACHFLCAGRVMGLDPDSVVTAESIDSIEG